MTEHPGSPSDAASEPFGAPDHAGKAEAASGPRFLRDGGAPAGPVLVYRVTAPEVVDRPDPALAEAIEVLAAHALDMGQRRLILLDRMAAPQVPDLLAAALGARRIARRAPGCEAARIPSLALVKTALEDHAPSSQDGPLLVWEPALAPFAGPELSPDWLEREGIILAIPLDADSAGPVAPLLDLYPDLHLLPWTGTFLRDLARHRGLGARDLQREVGAELAAAALIDGPEAGEREMALHVLLRALMTDGAIATHSAAVQAIRAAIGEARHGIVGIGRKTRQRIARIFAAQGEPEFGGPIGGVLLTLALLLPDQPAHQVLELARALLPEGPARLACLPDGLREVWERQSEDDQRLGLPRREPPGWPALLAAEGNRLLEAVGLSWGAGGRLVLRGDMASAAPLARLGDHRGLLADLIARLKARQLAATLPASHLPAFAALCVALHRLDSQVLGLEDLVTLLFDVPPDGGVLPGSGAPGVDGEQAFLRAVSHARQMLEWACASGSDATLAGGPTHGADGLEDGLARLLCARLSDLGAFTLLAFLMLYGPRPAPETVGRITLERFEGLAAADFTDTFRRLRDVLGNALGTAVEIGPEGAGRLDLWADGLWAAERRFGPVGHALALHVDDLMATWEIPWSPQLLRDEGDAGAVMARLALAPPGETEGLLARQFRRTPRERLEALDLLGRLSRGPRGAAAPALRAEDVVAQRLGDVAFILIDEVDADEAAARRLQPERLEALVLGALCEAYGLVAAPNRRALAALVLSPDRRGAVLLDLYAPALLFHWRLRLHGCGPLVAGSPGYEAFRATLVQVRSVGASRAGEIGAALSAMDLAQARLAAFFHDRACPRTAARHEARRAVLAAMRRVLGAPAPLALATPTRRDATTG